MRSNGQMRFLTVSTKFQTTALTVIVGVGLVCVCAMGVMAWGQYRAEADLASFQHEKAEVATGQQRLEAYGDNLDSVVEDLKLRQNALESMADMLPEEIRSVDTNVTDSSLEAAETVKKVGSLFPQARGLAEIEARQLALVENLTRFADWRARKAEDALRQLNLDPKRMTQEANALSLQAMGGPLEILTSASDGSLDPRFERLGLSLARMNALEEVLAGVPQVVPTPDGRVTSPFGYRRDPFTGRSAMHSGIDYGGPIGHPIYSAAAGTVTFVGWKSGYGKTIDVTHGNGMMTRYAHLNSFDVAEGDMVAAGETIAGLGNTGRSTGPHLHFEVRINNKAVNPRPFLESAPDVLKKVRETSGATAPRTAANTER